MVVLGSLSALGYGPLGNVTQLSEDRSDLIRPVHIDLRSEKSLYRINDQELRLILPDGSLNTIIGQCQRIGFVLHNDQNPVQISFGFMRVMVSPSGIAFTILMQASSPA